MFIEAQNQDVFVILKMQIPWDKLFISQKSGAKLMTAVSLQACSQGRSRPVVCAGFRQGSLLCLEMKR